MRCLRSGYSRTPKRYAEYRGHEQRIAELRSGSPGRGETQLVTHQREQNCFKLVRQFPLRTKFVRKHSKTQRLVASESMVLSLFSAAWIIQPTYVALLPTAPWMDCRRLMKRYETNLARQRRGTPLTYRDRTLPSESIDMNGYLLQAVRHSTR
jgi:hypothetical protein